MSIRRSVEGVQEPGERRQLKHRANGDSRTISAHPELAALLRSHSKEFGTAPDGRPFTGVHGRELATITCRRALISARKAALTEEQKSPLARRPYDLQHACLSTWLNGGVPATQVAEWAGHSVDVLLRIYAKCIVGQHETAHQVVWLMGDRGLPRTWRHMNGYSSHTYMWINERDQRFWVKYHFKTDQGIEFFTDAQAAQLVWAGYDYHTRDLFEAIDRGEHPSWTLHAQIMPSEDAKAYRFNPFDLTKVWPHADYPLVEVAG